MKKLCALALLLFPAFVAAQLTVPKLLIKMPTRSRPERFFNMLDVYYKNLSGLIPYHFLISCDEDDFSMNNLDVLKRLATYKNLTVNFSDNSSKIEAFNQGLNTIEFDILLCASDDMRPMVYGYDKVIVDSMREAFPDYDGVLNFHDGVAGAALNSYPIIGRRYFQRFGYVFWHEYQALYMNDEFTRISKILCKEKIFSQVLFRHEHAVFGYGYWDELYQLNESYKPLDKAVFQDREKINFGLTKKK